MTNPMAILCRINRGLFLAQRFLPSAAPELKQHDPAIEQLLAKLWGLKD